MSGSTVHVAIIGAGLGGLALANCLAQKGDRRLRITVFERRPTPAGPDGGALMLQGEALEVLDELGIGELLRAAAGTSSWEQHGIVVMRDALVELLLGRLGEQPCPVQVRDNTEVCGMSESAQGVTLEHRPLLVFRSDSWVKNSHGPTEKTQFDVVVGADGNAPSSQTARSIAGEQAAKAEPVPLLMIQALAPCETHRSGHRREDLTAEGVVDARLEVSAAIGLAEGALGQGTSASLQWWDVCSLTARLENPFGKFPKPDRWDDILRGHIVRLPDEEMRSVAGATVDRVRVGSLAGRLHAWVPFAKADLGRWTSTSGRLVALGDAAHLMPPMLGWGASCAMGDGRALADAFAEALPMWRASNFSAAGGPLEEYTQMRRSVALPKVEASAAEAAKFGRAARTPSLR